MQIQRRSQLGLLTGVLALTVSGILGLMIFRSVFVSESGLGKAVSVSQTASQPSLPSNLQWSGQEASSSGVDESQRFRLAGTFQTYSFQNEETIVSTQLAIVDDLVGNVQRMVREGDRIDSFEVKKIDSNAVLLNHEGEEIWLRLEGSTLPTVGARTSRGAQPQEITTFEDAIALEITPFGKRISTNQWVIQRSKVIEYVDELMANPVRGANMIQSMQPDRVDGEVAGFSLNMKGEEEFFASMGMKEGDTIRNVNSMKMKSARRATYMIQEFMKERMSAVVLDIERDGSEEKLIYIVR